MCIRDSDTIKELREKNGDNEELQKTINEHEQTIKRLETEAANTAKTYELKERLTAAGVLDPDYIIYKQGGIEKFIFDDKGHPVGVDDICLLYTSRVVRLLLYPFHISKEMILKRTCGNCTSVSYTHLDVYKRQVQGLQDRKNGSNAPKRKTSRDKIISVLV